MENTYNSIINSLISSRPPLYSDFFSLCSSVSDLLENEKTIYRPQNSNGDAGALLDFIPLPNLPLIVIPDIHARTFFLRNILDFEISAVPGFIETSVSTTVFEALCQKKIRIVCVGDALHTEKNTSERWHAIQEEFKSNIFTGTAMQAEATDCFSTLSAIMKLKLAFPDSFHFLKGNHENIYNTTGNGNYGFRKLADEGNMIKRFVQDYYGEDILYLISCYENSLPLMFSSNNCAISHAEPRNSYSRQEIIDAKIYPQIIDDLTWTANGQAKTSTAEKIINSLFSGSDCNPEMAIYLGGHRPVQGKYNLLQNGKYIQFHNPYKQNIALIYPNKIFNPDTDIIGVEKDE